MGRDLITPFFHQGYFLSYFWYFISCYLWYFIFLRKHSDLWSLRKARIIIIWVAVILHCRLLDTTDCTNQVQFAIGFHSYSFLQMGPNPCRWYQRQDNWKKTLTQSLSVRILSRQATTWAKVSKTRLKALLRSTVTAPRKKVAQLLCWKQKLKWSIPLTWERR